MELFSSQAILACFPFCPHLRHAFLPTSATHWGRGLSTVSQYQCLDSWIGQAFAIAGSNIKTHSQCSQEQGSSAQRKLCALISPHAEKRLQALMHSGLLNKPDLASYTQSLHFVASKDHGQAKAWECNTKGPQLPTRRMPAASTIACKGFKRFPSKSVRLGCI